MLRLSLSLIILFELFTFANRGGGPLFSHLALTGVTFLIVLIALIRGARFHFNMGLAEWTYLLFFICFVVSLFFSRTPTFGLNELLLFAATGILFFFFSSVELIERDLFWFATALVGIVALDVLAGTFIYIYQPFPRFVGTFIDLKDPASTFGNDFANLTLLTLPPALWLLLRHHERRTTTMLTLLATGLIGAAFVLGFSRGAWAAAFVAIVLAAGWGIAQKVSMGRAREIIEQGKDTLGLGYVVAGRSALLRILGAFVLTVVLATGLQLARERHFATLRLSDKVRFQADEGTSSLETRLEYWRASISLIGERPLVGHGVWSFRHVFTKYQQTFGISENHPHNIFFKIAIENGLPAAIFFMFFIIGVAWRALPELWKRRWPPVLFFFVAAMAAFGHNLLDFNFISSNFTLFMVFLALGIGYLRPLAKSQRQNTEVLVALLVASMLVLGIALFESYFNYEFKKGRGLMADSPEMAIEHIALASQRLVFERDASLFLADGYRKMFELSQESEWSERERIELQQALQKDHAVNAAAWSRLADAEWKAGNQGEAQRAASRALALDPMNNLKYYYQVLKYFNPSDSLYTATRERTLQLLENYKIILAQNRHHTILTENPQYAVALYELLEMPEEQRIMQELWFHEIFKFVTIYGKEALHR